jgi:hypothetical protein
VGSNLVGQPPPRHHTVGIGGGQPDRRVSDRSGREPAVRAAPTLRKETRRTQTRSPTTVSESSVQASSTTNTVTGSSTASAAAATLARHADNRSASSCAGMTTTILRNTGATRADWRPKRAHRRPWAPLHGPAITPWLGARRTKHPSPTSSKPNCKRRDERQHAAQRARSMSGRRRGRGRRDLQVRGGAPQSLLAIADRMATPPGHFAPAAI